MKNCGIKTRVTSVPAEGHTKFRNKVQGQASTIHRTCVLLNSMIFFFLISDARKQTHIGKWHVFNPLTARWLNRVPIAYYAFAQPVSHHFQRVKPPSWPR
jgi:hypothetical protein